MNMNISCELPANLANVHMETVNRGSYVLNAVLPQQIGANEALMHAHSDVPKLVRQSETKEYL